MAKRGKYVPGEHKLAVKRSASGLGLYAEDPIAKGTCVIEYVGRELSPDETESSKSKYLFEISKKRTIDGKPRINKAGYINHACKPNCETKIHAGRVFVMSIRNIRPGDELSYDYGKDYCVEHCVPCRCPAAKHLYE